ncbi:hypothetical protein [Micromonospora sp. NPDC002575]|uniref:hypothetical protein n=1 Tax=Micromonospora sp. NPDC002575 TaxID=3364222 RepID=UPI0036AB71E6
MGNATVEVSGAQAARWAAELRAALTECSQARLEVFARTSHYYELRLSADGEPHVDVVGLSVPAVAAQSLCQLWVLNAAAPDGH